MDKYIEENRHEFERVESFDMEASWMAIQTNNRLPKAKSKSWVLFVLIAISILILSSIFVWNSKEKSDFQQEIANIPEDMIENHEALISRVSQNEKRLEDFSFESAEFQEIMDEISELEEQKDVFRSDFNKTGNKEQYAKILLRHYERKARIIELLLYEMNKKEKNETIKQI
ncbi:hypothetical protein N9B82_02645 [Saprospiraceae bacterium]|nr:hypothetical protein [Saprospiraceae bacterium]